MLEPSMLMSSADINEGLVTKTQIISELEDPRLYVTRYLPSLDSKAAI